MNSFYYTLVTFLLSFSSFAQAPFITTWEVSSSDLSITIPINGNASLTYNYTADFGDGTVVSNISDSYTHVYGAPGTYTVEITGAFPAIRTSTNSVSDRDKLQSVEQWGDMQWETMNAAFALSRNLVINANDTPDLSQVTSMQAMFWGADSMNSDISAWDVSTIIDMSLLFYGAFSFNQPLNSWDVSNVTQMQNMFSKYFTGPNPQDMIFNQPLNSWDTSNVEDMESMFAGNQFFNQNINSWDVSNVVTMEEMFAATGDFNQPLNSWDVSNVVSMESMFEAANAFNQPLDNWVTSSLEEIRFMFAGTENFNGNIGTWDVSNVTDMGYVFLNALAFNKPIDNWDVSNVTDMNWLFRDAPAFNQSLNSWDVSSVTEMQYIFNNATSFNGAIGNWNIENLAAYVGMFLDASAFNRPLNNWDVSSFTSLNSFFKGATSFNQPLDSWDVSNVTNMIAVFEGASSFNQPLASWDVSNVTTMSGMFREASAFNRNLNSWDVSNVESMSWMFYLATSFNQPIYAWDVSNVTRIWGMFEDASSFNQPLDTWDVSNVDNTGAIDSFDDFLNFSSLNVENFDLFLDRLVNLGLTDHRLDAQGLQYCNQPAIDYLINVLNWSISGCFLAPSCYSIEGEARYDSNNNGCDLTDIAVNNMFVGLNNGSNTYSEMISNGIYETSVSVGTYDVAINNLPVYFDASPTSTTVTFPSNPQQQVVDFCISANQTANDLNIVLLPVSNARPGFDAFYELVVENFGTANITNITAVMEFDDSRQSFVAAIPAPSNVMQDSVTFSIASLAPFGKETIQIQLSTFAPPIVQGGTILQFTAEVSPVTDDFTPDDNTYHFNQIVVNSFDPNDKLVLQGSQILLEQADDYLDYIIRFQNTGTAEATFVRITDELDDKLDWSTLRIASASHQFSANLTNDNELELYFGNINLPPSSLDEEASKGYVSFRVKPKSNVQIGDVISGTAAIFFDYNDAIITNTVSTTIVEFLGVESFMDDALIVVFPNPSEDEIQISSREDMKLLSLTLYTLQGVELIRTEANLGHVDVSKLSSGMYVLSIETNRGVIVKQLLVE